MYSRFEDSALRAALHPAGLRETLADMAHFASRCCMLGCMSQIPLRIGELARRLATTPKTVRFYEHIGLLTSPARNVSGYRLYDLEAYDRARRIIALRRLGFSIDELKHLLDVKGESVRQRLSALMDERLRAVELELGVLQGRRDELAARHSALLATPRDRPVDCICDALFEPCTCTGRRPSSLPDNCP